jgi:hypothetical protein
VIVLQLLLLIPLAACEEEVPVQPNLPNANSAIVRQTIFGADDDRTVVAFLALDFSDDVYFSGWRYPDYFVGRFADPTGIDWALTPGIDFLGLRVFPAIFGASNEVVMAVGRRHDAADAVLVGYDGSGTVLTENTFWDAGHRTWFSDVVMVSVTPTESRFVAAGTVRRSGVRYPYLCDVTLSSAGDVVTSRERVALDYPGAGVIVLVRNADPDSLLFFGAVDRFDSEGKSDGGEVFCFDDSLNVAWTLDVKPADAGWVTVEGIDYYDGSVYTAGRRSVLKEDQWWRAGTIASVSESGDLNWTRTVTPSDFHDEYWECIVDGGALYAVGEYATVEQRSTTHEFGYGLLSKFELPTGTPLFHKSFGNQEYASGFFAVEVRGDRAFCGGFTKKYLAHYWYQGWFVEVDLGDQQTQLAPAAQMQSSPQTGLKPDTPRRRFGPER